MRRSTLSRSARMRVASDAAVENLEGRTMFSLLGINVGPNPPIMHFDSTGTTEYDPSSTDVTAHAFDVTALPLYYVDANGNRTFYGSSAGSQEDFEIHVRVGNDGSLIGGVGSAVQIGSDTGDDLLVKADDGSTLLSGKATAFGFDLSDPNTEHFDFRFTPTYVAPALQADFTGQDIGVDLYTSPSAPFSGFTGALNGNAQGFLAPIPPNVVPHVSPSIVTTPGGAVVIGSGAKLMDSATLSGGNNETGTVTFYLFAPGVTPNASNSNNVYRDTVAVNGDGTYTTAVGTNPGGFLPGSTGTYQWVAVYSGDTSNNPATSPFGSEPETSIPASPTIATTPSATAVTLGTSTVTLKDTADLELGYQPTGTITFTLVAQGGATVDTETVPVNGDGLYTTPTGYTLPTTGAVSGTYQWNATYSGDANNNTKSETNDSTERVVVSPATPALATVPSQTSITLGNAVPPVLMDTAMLSGGYAETGTITFTLIAPGGGAVDTETVSVSGNGTYTTPTGYTLPANASVTGAYQWAASYSGDANNLSVDENNPVSERVVISPASPSIVTTPSPATVSLGTGTVNLKDTAVLSGGYNPTGSITFTLVAPGGSVVDTETVAISGDGSYTTPVGYALPSTGTVTGTYQWNATYTSGNGNNLNTSDVANAAERVTVSPATPAITTTPVIVTSTGSGGQYATIGFWHNRNGQAVITNFNGSSTSTLLGNSLASNYPHLFGASNPYTGTSLAGLTNAQVAQVYLNLWTPSGLQKNTYVQAFAVALGGYSSNGAGVFNVGSNGAAFGVANNTTLPITQILQVADANFSSSTGLFYGGDSTKSSALNTVLNNINQAGETPGGIPVVSVGTINDTAALSGTYNPGGTVAFYLFAPGVTPNASYSNNVYSDIVTVTGNGPYSTATQGNNPGGYVTTSTGTYQWVAVYSGDGDNTTVTSPFGSEPVTIGQQSPTISSTPNATAVTLGTSGVTLKDTVALASGDNPTGTLTWTLYLGNTLLDTETVTVNGNGSYTTPTGYTLPTMGSAVGTYQWNASYSGDANNAADSDINDVAERTVVSPAMPTITTTPSPNSITLGSSSVTLKDTAALAGAYSPTGTITFTLIGPDGKTTLDTETVTVNGDGSYTTPTGYSLSSNAAAGTYQWNATYSSGNGNNLAVCDISDVNEQVTVNSAPSPKGSISGYVFCDDNLNGLFDSSETGEAGATIKLSQGTTTIATTTSGTGGYYSFGTLPLGTYTVSITGYSPGHQAELSHGSVTNSTSTTVTLTVSNPTAAGPAGGAQGSAGTNNGLDFAETEPGGLEGFVWDDTNNDGNIDFNEAGIVNVTVQLNGVTYTGAKVSLTTVTDGNGEYLFANLQPGTYSLTEGTPNGYTDGKDSVGSLGGCNNAQNSFSGIQIGGCDDLGFNYNFAEHSQSLTSNSNGTATIGFWHNKNGQALLCSLNGGSNSTALGNWLATTFPNMYGANAAVNFAGKTNSWIAAFYNANDFSVTGMKLNAQVLSAAFACYVTNSTWAGGTTAATYGFKVSAQGTGYLTVNVGSNGSAFGVANNSTITILQALDATDQQSVDGLLYNGNVLLRTMANNVYSTINQTGDVG